jgi:ABC-type transport system involved in cytochrome bd biosynthesis fused ATPase/permease subunit
VLLLLAHVRVRLYERLGPLAPAGLVVFRSADLLHRLVEDVEALQEFFLRVVTPVLAAVLLLGLAVAVTWPLAPPVAMELVLASLLGGVVAPLLARSLARRPSTRVASSRAELSTRLLELLEGAQEVVALGRSRDRLAGIAGTDRTLSRLGTRLAISGAALDGGILALGGLTLAATLWVAIPLVSSGRLDGVMFAALALATMATFEAVQPLPAAIQRLEASLASARRLREIEQAPVPVADLRPADRPPSPPQRPPGWPTCARRLPRDVLRVWLPPRGPS